VLVWALRKKVFPSALLRPGFLILTTEISRRLTGLMDAVSTDREKDFSFLGCLHNFPGFLDTHDDLQGFFELFDR
jgi:hypothetical protein